MADPIHILEAAFKEYQETHVVPYASEAANRVADAARLVDPGCLSPEQQLFVAMCLNDGGHIRQATAWYWAAFQDSEMRLDESFDGIDHYTWKCIGWTFDALLDDESIDKATRLSWLQDALSAQWKNIQSALNGL